MTDPILSVRDLSVAFHQGGNTSLAVDSISFDIKRGETVALVGESGSGKSVSANSILKLLPYPSASHPGGEIRFNGKDLLKASDAELRHVRGNDITMIFQEPMTSLNPLHPIERQIGEILELHQGLEGAAARTRILELLNQVGIREPEKRLGAYPHELSGGQRQRVMIAMALANRPELLIADEPTTALDVTVQAQILELLKTLKDEHGMSMLFITHDLGIVRKIADRVCVMTKGKIVETGPTAEIFANPQHAYTRHLLASEPRGNPPLSDASKPVVMEAADVKVWFPIKSGFLRKVVDHVKAVDGIDLKLRAGQTLGVVGEFGLRQDDPWSGLDAADIVQGADCLRRQGHRRLQLPRDATTQKPDAGGVPGSLRFSEPAHVGLRHHRRRVENPRESAVGRRARSARCRSA